MQGDAGQTINNKTWLTVDIQTPAWILKLDCSRKPRRNPTELNSWRSRRAFRCVSELLMAVIRGNLCCPYLGETIPPLLESESPVIGVGVKRMD
ncbi:hypothetical protein EYF80_032652 [Liparis tanakae]|uniref:Uncharacterized protein n=1 Tax=Liparis tanakae TaxID=230148 RepID=A0A4Z2GUN8_9TELE|nr:hypothetical protein EYF80_032652 [Liparis tanakae]